MKSDVLIAEPDEAILSDSCRLEEILFRKDVIRDRLHQDSVTLQGLFFIRLVTENSIDTASPTVQDLFHFLPYFHTLRLIGRMLLLRAFRIGTGKGNAFLSALGR
jgi:hypothetical protein